jgi:hypothetical protein
MTRRFAIVNCRIAKDLFDEMTISAGRRTDVGSSTPRQLVPVCV